MFGKSTFVYKTYKLRHLLNTPCLRYNSRQKTIFNVVTHFLLSDTAALMNPAATVH